MKRKYTVPIVEEITMPHDIVLAGNSISKTDDDADQDCGQLSKKSSSLDGWDDGWDDEWDDDK